MNAEGLELGERLDKFKQASKDLPPPLRGNMLSNSSWIRVAHNSFARLVGLISFLASIHADSRYSFPQPSRTIECCLEPFEPGRGQRGETPRQETQDYQASQEAAEEDARRRRRIPLHCLYPHAPESVAT